MSRSSSRLKNFAFVDSKRKLEPGITCSRKTETKSEKRKTKLRIEYEEDKNKDDLTVQKAKKNKRLKDEQISDEIKSEKWEPKAWDVILDNIREMRKGKDAPVDTMGCHKSFDDNVLPQVQRYQILVSLMLSSQTKDQVNNAAMQRLINHGLTIENMLETDEKTVAELIYPVGFSNTKAKNLKKVAEILKNEYSNDIPNTVESLCKLPGVGPKMAHIAMKVAWNTITGIGVDTHVHRISNRLKWTKKTTKQPEQTRKEIESWLPQELWGEVNELLVGFGQTICRPVNPLCQQCLNRKICPSSTYKKS